MRVHVFLFYQIEPNCASVHGSDLNLSAGHEVRRRQTPAPADIHPEADVLMLSSQEVTGGLGTRRSVTSCESV